MCLGEHTRSARHLLTPATRKSGISDIDTWGVSDPAGGPGAAFAIYKRGRLTPHPCSTPGWGAGGAAEGAAPIRRADWREPDAVQGVERAR